jgi:hypothetical protein
MKVKALFTNILARILRGISGALCFIACIIYFEARIYAKRGPQFDIPKYPLEKLRFSMANPLMTLGGTCEGISDEM